MIFVLNILRFSKARGRETSLIHTLSIEEWGAKIRWALVLFQIPFNLVF